MEQLRCNAYCIITGVQLFSSADLLFSFLKYNPDSFVCIFHQGFTAPEVVKKVVGKDGQQATLYPQFLMPLINLLSQGATDPFFAVLSYRNFKPEAL